MIMFKWIIISILLVALAYTIKEILYGDCPECGKKIGFLKGEGWDMEYCSEKCKNYYNSKQIRYKDKVRIKTGTFENMIGIIVSDRHLYATSFIGHYGRTQFYGYKVKFDEDTTERIDEYDLEKVGEL